MDALFRYTAENSPGNGIWAVLVDLQGGAIDAIAQDATAYAHRGSLINIQFYAVDLTLFDGTFAPNVHDFVKGAYNAVVSNMPNLKVRCHPGYVDPELDPNEYEEIYWGDNVPKLVDIKTKYDLEF